jgi:predicted Zn-dependent peptidase
VTQETRTTPSERGGNGSTGVSRRLDSRHGRWGNERREQRSQEGLPATACVVNELKILRMLLGSNALTSQYVDRSRRMAAGVYTGRLLTLSQRAQEIAGLADFGLGADGVNTVLRQIALTKPADIRRVLKRYVDASTILLVLPHGQESR